jgi:hypothetical protein
MSNDRAALDELWRIRNAAATTLIETFAPGRSSGPEWTRTFEPLIERLWAWRDDETIAALARVFGARGLPWAAVARALSPEQGMASRAAPRQAAWARLPAFTVV